LPFYRRTVRLCRATAEINDVVTAH
jgi:hypothetical protein